MNNVRLTREQEERRLDGLRILARIIARHNLPNLDLYPQFTAGNSRAVRSESDSGQEEDAK